MNTLTCWTSWPSLPVGPGSGAVYTAGVPPPRSGYTESSSGTSGPSTDPGARCYSPAGPVTLPWWPTKRDNPSLHHTHTEIDQQYFSSYTYNLVVSVWDTAIQCTEHVETCMQINKSKSRSIVGNSMYGLQCFVSYLCLWFRYSETYRWTYLWQTDIYSTVTFIFKHLNTGTLQTVANVLLWTGGYLSESGGSGSHHDRLLTQRL